MNGVHISYLSDDVILTAPRHDNDDQSQGLYRGDIAPLQRTPRYSLGFSVLVVIAICLVGWVGIGWGVSLLL